MTLYFHLSWRSQSISGIWRFICPIKVHLVLRVLNVKESEGFKFSICIKVFLYILVLHLYEGFSICLVWYLYEGLFLYLYLRLWPPATLSLGPLSAFYSAATTLQTKHQMLFFSIAKLLQWWNLFSLAGQTLNAFHNLHPTPTICDSSC